MKNVLLIFALALMISCNTDKETHVLIETTEGDIEIILYNETPIHRDNFIKLVKDEYYDDLLFHRVMDKFMIQGGDPQSKNAAPGKRLGMGGPGYTLDAEIGIPHLRGTVAAARLGGAANPDKRSSGSQFYIVHGRTYSDNELTAFETRNGIKYNETQRQKYMEVGGTPQLDMEYTVFGEVVTGMDVVDKIATLQTDSNDRPVEDVRMISVRLK